MVVWGKRGLIYKGSYMVSLHWDYGVCYHKLSDYVLNPFRKLLSFNAVNLLLTLSRYSQLLLDLRLAQPFDRASMGSERRRDHHSARLEKSSNQ